MLKGVATRLFQAFPDMPEKFSYAKMFTINSYGLMLRSVL